MFGVRVVIGVSTSSQSAQYSPRQVLESGRKIDSMCAASSCKRQKTWHMALVARNELIYLLFPSAAKYHDFRQRNSRASRIYIGEDKVLQSSYIDRSGDVL